MFFNKIYIIFLDERENRHALQHQVHYRAPHHQQEQVQNYNLHLQTRAGNNLAASTNQMPISPPQMSSTTGITNVGTVPHFANSQKSSHNNNSRSNQTNYNANTDKKFDKKKKKDRKLQKEDISNPTNFK